MSETVMPSRTRGARTAPLPLHEGDHLSASEFLRRYEAMDDQVQAELVDGVVHIMLPAHFGAHGKPDSIIAMWLSHYAAFTPSVEHAAGPTVKLSRIDVPQPRQLAFSKT